MKMLFIHGTGVRHHQYQKTLRLIREGLGKLNLPQMEIEGCLWGDAAGTKLNAGGLSIPEYSGRGGRRKPTDQELEIELWMYLYSDPLYELRVLSLSTVRTQGNLGQLTPGQLLDIYVKKLTITSDLQDRLEGGEIDAFFSNAHANIINSLPYQEMLQTVTEPMGIFQLAVARAIVAEAMVLSETESGIEPELRSQAILRDEIVALTRKQLGPYQAAVGNWIVRKLLSGLARIGTSAVLSKRGSNMDMVSPKVGDILLYQARGKRIRDLINLTMSDWLNEKRSGKNRRMNQG